MERLAMSVIVCCALHLSRTQARRSRYCENSKTTSRESCAKVGVDCPFSILLLYRHASSWPSLTYPLFLRKPWLKLNQQPRSLHTRPMSRSKCISIDHHPECNDAVCTSIILASSNVSFLLHRYAGLRLNPRTRDVSSDCSPTFPIHRPLPSTVIHYQSCHRIILVSSCDCHPECPSISFPNLHIFTNCLTPHVCAHLDRMPDLDQVCAGCRASNIEGR